MFLVTLALGTIVVAAIATSPLYAARLRTAGSLRLSGAAISLALAIPLFCAASPAAAGMRSELFLCSLFLILVGALLVPRDGDDPGDDKRGPDDEPPWWPEFERAFRSYARRRRRPVRTR